MPLVRIAVRAGQYPRKTALGDAVHQAMVETIGVPAQDRFQIITEHPADGLSYDPSYLGISRGDGIVLVQIALNAGRTLAQKQALYARIAALLETAAGVRPGDVLVNLVEVPKENWSFGAGIAQYAV